MSAVISSYTRTEAIADGVLVDVSDRAREAGINFPTAVTSTVWARCVEVPAACPWQDEEGRLWDVLWMLRYAVGRSNNVSELTFVVLVQNSERGPKEVQLKAVCGPGDAGEPVITVMLPEED